MLRPIIRLALALGLKYPQLESVLRDLLLDEARSLLLARGVTRPNISQLAMATGLNRKDVTVRVRLADSPMVEPAPSTAAQVFTSWLSLATANSAMRQIPVKADGNEVSFESLAKQASKGNVHHRAVLDELIRLGMVVELNGLVDLTADAFIPATDLKSMLGFLGGNTRDHLKAAVENILGASPRFLERAVYADGVSATEAERLHQLARMRWEALHHELVTEMSASIERSGPDSHHRVKVGVYVLYEDDADQSEAEHPVKLPSPETDEIKAP